MIAFESPGQFRWFALSALLSLVAGAPSARAEVLVPFTPGNQLVPAVHVTVTNADGVYTYAYKIALDGSDPAKQQKASTFALELHGDVSNATTPRGWHFGQYRTEPLFAWGCIEPEPLKPGETDDGNLPPCRYSIAPGSKLAGFSFRSIHPPGSVRFMIRGEKKWPVATSESDDLGPNANPDIRVDSVSGETTGPVRVQTCSGPDTDGAHCDDGYFCNGPDTCSNGECVQHAGNPCTGKDDGDADCAEDCDEVQNDCSRYDESGSPCPDDGNPCTIDECELGECVHPPGNAGAVCGAPQDDRHAERTCTGASIVCPSTSISLEELGRARAESEKQKAASEKQRNEQIASMLAQERDALARIEAATFNETYPDIKLVTRLAKDIKVAGSRQGIDLINEYFAAVDGNINPGASDEEAARIFRDSKMYDWIATNLAGEDELAPAMLEGLRKIRGSMALRAGCSYFDMRHPKAPRRFDAKNAEALLVAIDRRGPYGTPPEGSEDFCAEAFKSQIGDPDTQQSFFENVYPQLTPEQKEIADKLSKEPPRPFGMI